MFNFAITAFQEFHLSKSPDPQLVVDLESFKAFRKKYFQVVAALWLYFDTVMDGHGPNKASFKDAEGLKPTYMDQLWSGVAANLPPDISVEEAKAIVDHDDVVHMRLPVPTQYQGRALREKLEGEKKVSSGHPINAEHGKNRSNKNTSYFCHYIISLFYIHPHHFIFFGQLFTSALYS